MKKVFVNGMVVQVYDSIDEMPIENFQKYNKYLLIDAGIGSDADDADAHLVKIAKHIGAGKTDKALQELQNLRQNLYLVNAEMSPKYMAFAALVCSVDGEKVTDLSDDGLKELLGRLRKIKHSAITDILAWLKKKFRTS